MPVKFIKTFFKSEVAIGVSLFLATIAALVAVNSTAFSLYESLFEISFLGLSLRDFINDALMAIFFLLIGLELKKEVLVGELSSKKKMILPAFAALGGVILPMLIFAFFNFGDAQRMRGFAIPAATDIAFAYGMIALFGKRISNPLKVFLVALAIIDDLIAILIIAFFYSQNIDFTALSFAALTLGFLYFLNQKNCTKISFYLLGGILLWFLILKSGIHATLAGVLTALFIPLEIKNEAPLSKLAHKISPTVNFLILPIFAFANAGVYLGNFSSEILFEPLVIGIALGLFIGKQLGVMLFSWIAVKLKIAQMPRGSSFREFYAVAIFAGIGFTMSIFIATLAFKGAIDNLPLDYAKVGILLGSALSMIFGSIVIFSKTSRHGAQK